MDYSSNLVYSYRIDAKHTDDNLKELLSHIRKKNPNVLYIGKNELSDNNKPHYQLCLIFDSKPDSPHFRNIKKKSWILPTKQPVSFTKARKPEILMSYVTKEDTELITNMSKDMIKSIKPWKSKKDASIDKFEYILNYTKKLLKDINIEYVGKSYNTEYTFFPSESKDGLENKNSTNKEPYEYGDRLDTGDKLAILVNATSEYFRKFNIIMTKKTQLKIMIATKMYSFYDYTIDNFHNIFSQYRV